MSKFCFRRLIFLKFIKEGNELLLLIFRQIEEIQIVHRKALLIALPVGLAPDCRIAADRDGALLTIHQLITPVGGFGPVHHVDREFLFDGTNNLIPVFVGIDVFTLIGGAHIQPAAIGHHTLNAIWPFFFIAVNQFLNCHLDTVNIHLFFTNFLSNFPAYGSTFILCNSV